MNVTQLRAFHLVAQERSFTNAARAASISQPTLSGQVKALEDTYRVRLFERRGRGVQLTELGQSLFGLTNRLFGVVDEAQALLAGTKALTRGHLRVAADSAYHVIPILAELKQRHGGLTFALSIGNSATVLQAAVRLRGRRRRDGEDDLRPPPVHHAVPARPTRAVRAPAPRSWPSASASELGDLQGQELVLRERGSITREVFEQTPRRARRPAGCAGRGTDARGRARGGRRGLRRSASCSKASSARDARFHPIHVSDADLAVAEYAICLQERRRLALVRAFLDIAETLSPERRRAPPAAEP